MIGAHEQKPADAVAGSWVDSLAPGRVRPYLRLARADRPIGGWLLLWPGWWSLALAGAPWPDPVLLALFFIGAFAMRAAGCAYNDIVDRDFDGRVARTRGRPIPSGAISLTQAVAFMVFLCLIGLAVLLQLNRFAILLGLASLVVVACYPFMKRITYWPQLVLGLAFNWGALLGWAAATGGLSAAPVALYIGGIFWTPGYDTIYAPQDKEDDILIGVKSAALRLGEATRPWLWGFYGLFLFCLALAGALVGLSAVFYLGLALAAGHLAWQVATLDIHDGANCLARFKSNSLYGWIVFAAIIAGKTL